MFLREGTVETSEWEEIYFWQHSRHGTVVELFTLITSPLMPAAVWNQSGPSGPGKSLMWRAFVVWWGLLKEGEGGGKKRNIVTGFFKISQLPPTSLVAYKKRVIVCICVFLSAFEITVTNQCDREQLRIIVSFLMCFRVVALLWVSTTSQKKKVLGWFKLFSLSEDPTTIGYWCYLMVVFFFLLNNSCHLVLMVWAANCKLQ